MNQRVWAPRGPSPSAHSSSTTRRERADSSDNSVEVRHGGDHQSPKTTAKTCAPLAPTPPRLPLPRIEVNDQVRPAMSGPDRSYGHPKASARRLATVPLCSHRRTRRRFREMRALRGQQGSRRIQIGPAPSAAGTRSAPGDKHVGGEDRADTCLRAGIYRCGRRRGWGLREQPRRRSCLASSSLLLRVKVNGGRAVALCGWAVASYVRAPALSGRPTGTSGCRSRRTRRCSRGMPRARACRGCTTRPG